MLCVLGCDLGRLHNTQGRLLRAVAGCCACGRGCRAAAVLLLVSETELKQPARSAGLALPASEALVLPQSEACPNPADAFMDQIGRLVRGSGAVAD